MNFRQGVRFWGHFPRSRITIQTRKPITKRRDLVRYESRTRTRCVARSSRSPHPCNQSIRAISHNSLTSRRYQVGLLSSPSSPSDISKQAANKIQDASFLQRQSLQSLDVARLGLSTTFSSDGVGELSSVGLHDNLDGYPRRTARVRQQGCLPGVYGKCIRSSQGICLRNGHGNVYFGGSSGTRTASDSGDCHSPDGGCHRELGGGIYQEQGTDAITVSLSLACLLSLEFHMADTLLPFRHIVCRRRLPS